MMGKEETLGYGLVSNGERNKMGIIVNHQRGRFRGSGLTTEKAKQILFKNYPFNTGIKALKLDHVIPYSISLDNSLSNLQLLTKREHDLKSIKDRKIIRLFRQKGWIEKITHYSHELKKTIGFLVKKYKVWDGWDGWDTTFS